MPMMYRVLLALTLLLAGFWSAPSYAEVRPNLTCSATFTSPMTFSGSALAGKQLRADMDMKVRCSDAWRWGGTNVLVCVDIGNSDTRQLVNGSSKLNFQIYMSDSATVWGGTAGKSWSSGTLNADGNLWSGSNVRKETTAKGVIFADQQVIRGTYTSDFTGQVKVRWAASPSAANCDQTLTDEQSAISSFSVTYTVPEHCDVSASTLDFGTQGPLNKKIDAQGSVGVTCTKGTPYSVALGNGLSGTTPQTRKMTGPGVDKIAYELYRDAARSLTWGSTSTGAATDNVASGKTGTGAEEKIPVYGRIPAQDSVATGDYSDSVVVTVTY